MALQGGQYSASLGTLYQCEQVSEGLFKRIKSYVWINSGSVDIYTSSSATQPTSLSAMTLNADDTGLSGHEPFRSLPGGCYIAIVQNTGTTTEIVFGSVKITSLGAIS